MIVFTEKEEFHTISMKRPRAEVDANHNSFFIWYNNSKRLTII